jgi:hypothetical protein
MTENALDRIDVKPASDELIEAVASIALMFEEGKQLHRHQMSLLEDALPHVMVRVRELRSRVAELEVHPVDWDAQKRRADIAEEEVRRYREENAELSEELKRAWDGRIG